MLVLAFNWQYTSDVLYRFHSLSMDDFRCIAVLGRGHFGKVDLLLSLSVGVIKIENYRMIALHGIHALCLLRCFKTVGWVTGRLLHYTRITASFSGQHGYAGTSKVKPVLI